MSRAPKSNLFPVRDRLKHRCAPLICGDVGGSECCANVGCTIPDRLVVRNSVRGRLRAAQVGCCEAAPW
jgi:hypothetical protein